MAINKPWIAQMDKEQREAWIMHRCTFQKFFKCRLTKTQFTVLKEVAEFLNDEVEAKSQGL
jgi:hypothetical protein